MAKVYKYIPIINMIYGSIAFNDKFCMFKHHTCIMMLSNTH